MASAYAFSTRVAERWSSQLVEAGEGAVEVKPVLQAEAAAVLESHSPLVRAWAAASKFAGKSGEVLLVPGGEGALAQVLLGLESPTDLWGYAALPSRLPGGVYRLSADSVTSAEAASKAALGFALGTYAYERYKKPKGEKEGAQKVQLVWPERADKASVTAMAAAIFLTRDLINTPAEDLGPQHMVEEAGTLAARHGASITVIQGEELLEQNYPAIHIVGRASYRPPALIDIRWSPPGRDASSLPLLALVGKGVCFDSGGLDIKPASGMKFMKKDMGGAALMLALGHVVMSGGLPVRLRLLVPTVENSISGNAYRPLDVLQTRAGITVENGNTDAEGRLILCDALYEAASEAPDLLIDAATLTGAARVALGPDLPGVFCNSDEVWAGIEAAAAAEGDPVWRLPLHKAYRKMIDSKVADLSSTGGDSGLGGAITAALYLQEFVKDSKWVHIDTNAYNPAPVGPGRPEGGDAQTLRALWKFLQTRYP